jgi:hypothetical protein
MQELSVTIWQSLLHRFLIPSSYGYRGEGICSPDAVEMKNAGRIAWFHAFFAWRNLTGEACN